MASLDDVARIAASLPETVDGERHGNRTWFVSGKAFAWDRPFSKADRRRYGDVTPPAGPILALSVADLAEKDAVLATSSAAVFTIPHFDGYAAVLVELDAVSEAELHELMNGARFACARVDLAERYASS